MPSTIPVRSIGRRAYCPLCGCERTERPVSELRELEDALCPGRCTTAWHALVALRLRESTSGRVAERRRTEYESRQPHESSLSELMLLRWRAGDWAIAPEDVLAQIATADDASVG